MSVHGNFGMIVPTQQFCSLQANGAITERRALCAASHDTDVLGHMSSLSSGYGRVKQIQKFQFLLSRQE